MADKKNETSTTQAVETVYVTEEAPNLPTADVSVKSEPPVIDKRLIELRNAEAKTMADRFK